MGTSLTRRDLLKASSAAAAVASLPGLALAQEAPELTPQAKRRKLIGRGEPEKYSNGELKFIGMPVGGLFAGTVYLGGDGQLWNWDIFNQERLGCVDRGPTVFMGDTLNAMSGANYVDPVRQQSPFEQRFELLVEGEKPHVVRFGNVEFRGEYPVGRVEYTEADADLEMTLEAFSPFCPLDAERSSFPATTLTFKIKNVGTTPLDLRLQYRADNPALVYSRSKRDDFTLTGIATSSHGAVLSAEAKPRTDASRPDIVFENWSSGTYGKWVATGTAFGDRPRKVSELPGYMGSVQAGTEFVVNSHQTRNGEDVEKADAHTGTLRSPAFVINRKFINLRVGGGSHKDATCVNLLVDGKVVRSCTGRDNNAMNWESFLVADLEGKEAQLEVVDRETGPWGNISLGEVEFADQPKTFEDLLTLPDYGSFSIEFVGGADPGKVDAHHAEVAKKITVNPGDSREVTLVVAWHFPNCSHAVPGKQNWYATQWKDAHAVSKDLMAHWPELQATTRAWNKTWYDSTLPYWFLDRTFVNTSILATTTCHRLDEGRYYFSEGSGCCAGTCTHVWGYAQAVGRVFPEVERYLRKEIDFGRAYHKDTGAIDYRAEYHQIVAHDGQASCILRAYREHQMSNRDEFLKSIWPQVKGAMEYLIRQDTNQDGILEGAQYNTLDTAWYGSIAWISSLYVAALRASEAMALEMGDSAFATHCGEIAARGSSTLVSELFNGEYFVNRADPAHPEANNTREGCHIDQVYGQSWAHQVDLPRVVPQEQSIAALHALYKHNFFEDIWEYRRKMKEIPGGRWYATPKEGGLIMCSFPRGGAASAVGKGSDAWAVGYFNECMSGFEYQVANHMIAEGMVDEGLTLVQAIHERYHGSKRNPYNEIECSDHYGRAMASYGAFVAICGFKVHGPTHQMSFAPKIAGKSFRCPFINEQGWGVYHRTPSGKENVVYHYQSGKLKSA